MRRLRPGSRVRRQGHEEARRERGAVLVEFTAFATLLITLVFGIAEFGFGWQDRMTVETAARAGARTGSSVGKERLADYALLEGVRTVLEEVGIDNVDLVVVYKATSSDGAVPEACKNGTPLNGVCNVYTAGHLASLSPAMFGGSTGCSGSAPDRYWCPTTRKTVQSQGTDYIGVYVKATLPTVTNLFGSARTVSTKAVMRLEPAEG